MNRDIAALADGVFDLLVIGGGVLGACAARDAALRGLRTALIERDDFASGTSWNSLKIVHGGLRDLLRGDLRRARESVRERSILLRIAPHLVEPLPVLVPASGRGLERRSLLRAALLLNDLVSAGRNRGLAEDRRLPAGRGVGPDECLELAACLERRDLAGGALFHDGQMYAAERLVLAVAEGAARAGAVLANHAEYLGPLLRDGRLIGARARDRSGGDELEIRARVVVDAAGPGSDRVARSLTGREAAGVPAWSVALNLVLPRLEHRVAFTLAGEDPDAGAAVGRRLLVVPWRGRSIVGTGHLPLRSPPGEFRPEERHVAAFLAELAHAWPGRPWRAEDVALVHAGLLPAAPRAGRGVRLLRRRRLIDHARHGRPEAITAVSVKFTTARLLAEEAVDLACRKLGREPIPSRAGEVPLPGAPAGGLEELRRSAARHPLAEGLADDVLDHLVRSYGTEYRRILAWRRRAPDWDRRLDPRAPVIRAQLLHAVREEMAVCPDDLLLRRTELGPRGLASANAVAMAAEVLASEDGGAGRRHPVASSRVRNGHCSEGEGASSGRSR